MNLTGKTVGGCFSFFVVVSIVSLVEVDDLAKLLCLVASFYYLLFELFCYVGEGFLPCVGPKVSSVFHLWVLLF